jgi:hypothetical protein
MTLEFMNRALLNVDMPSWAYIGTGLPLGLDMDTQLAGTANWNAGNGATLSKQSGAPGYAQCLRVEYNGVANPYAGNTSYVQTIGRWYRLRGFARGNGVLGRPVILDSGATTLFSGSTSTTWQYYDVTFQAVGFALYFFNVAASGYADFTMMITELAPASTRNLGTLGGYMQLGDGYTAAGFPTQVFPHGMSFDGGDYLRVANDGTFDFRVGGVDQPFSLEVLVKDNLTSNVFMSKGAFAAAPGGWFFYTSPNLVLMQTDSAGNYFYTYSVALYSGVVTHFTAVSAGGGSSGVSLFINGSQRATTTGTLGVYGGLPTGVLPVLIGSGAGVASFNGSMYNAAIYPFALQPGEVAQLCRLRLGLLNRGA